MAVDFPTALLDAQVFERKLVFILKFYTQPLMSNFYLNTVKQRLKTEFLTCHIRKLLENVPRK